MTALSAALGTTAALGRGALRRLAGLKSMGPAFVASIAFMDPGNYATNIGAGAHSGYALLWVVVLSNLIAMLFQSMSAKLGIVTGKNLAELSRQTYPPRVVYAMWAAAELAAMATDLAEFLGASLALQLLFHIPLVAGTLIVGVVTYAALQLPRLGVRTLESFLSALVGVIGLSYLCEIVLANPDWRMIAYHSVVPTLAGPDSLMLAVGIVGATVMPHAIYLHSSLTQDRGAADASLGIRKRLRLSNLDVVIAFTVAGAVNMAMLCMSAAVFHDGVHDAVGSLEVAYQTLGPLLGKAAAGVFLISLLASGFSSSVVGTMAGQVVMQGFVGWRIPLWLRRAVTMAPAVAVAALGLDATNTLIVSQVVLSLVLPLPVLTLIAFTGRTDIMGEHANRRLVSLTAKTAAAAILLLNLFLLADALT